LAALGWLFLPGEPSYQGKPVSTWFEEYARMSYGQGTTIHVMQGPTGRILMRDGSYAPLPDPAWEALKALGSNAVPHLTGRVRGNVLDQPYERIFTNLPPAIQRKLPNPWMKKWYRRFAVEALGGLGEHARSASPALLEALKRPDPLLRSAVIQTLRKLHVDRRSLSDVMLELGSKHRYADVIEIAQRAGWEGDDVARLLGNILQSPDPALRSDAIRLLERSGTAAAPALDEVILALKDSDREVRYLAARSVEANGTSTPQIVNALRASLADENIMVQNVARRALLKLAPDTVQLEK